MKFRLRDEYHAAKVGVGETVVSVTADDRDVDSWDLGTCENLLAHHAFAVIEESAGDVIDQLGELSDQELSNVVRLDPRPSVRAAVAEEIAERAKPEGDDD